MSRREGLARVHASIADIPNSSTLYHVPHCETFDGLVFGNTARAVRATHEVDLATAFPVAAAISSFFSLQRRMYENRHPRVEKRIRPNDDIKRRIFGTKWNEMSFG